MEGVWLNQGKTVAPVSTCGYFRSHLREPSFPLEGTVVPTWGNRRSHLGKLSFLLGEITVPACGNGRSLQVGNCNVFILSTINA